MNISVETNESGAEPKSSNKVPVLLGSLLFLDWFLAIIGFRLTLSFFADFKVGISSLTLWAINLSQGLILGYFTALVFVVAILVSLRYRLGRYLAFMVCGACDLLFIAVVMPFITLINGLGGGDEAVVAGVPMSFIKVAPSLFESGTIMLILSFCLTQLIFVLLLFRKQLWIR